MIWWIPTILLFLLAVWRDGLLKKKEDISILVVICFGITLIVSLVVSGIVISEKEDVIRIERDITVAEERFEGISKTILYYVGKYPAEGEVLKSFNPSVLLELPEIKSDSFLTSQINLAVKYQDEIYNLKTTLNMTKKNLGFHSYRWFSPTLASPKYSEH